MKNAEIAKQALNALGSFQNDALGLANIKDMPDRIRAALKILGAVGSGDVVERRQRVQRNIGFADTQTDAWLRGVALYTAIQDLFFVIAERAAQQDS